jgi:hypothetical protein
MRKRLALPAALLLAALAGCKTYQTGEFRPPVLDDDAAFEAAPPRQVITDGGLVGGGTAYDGGSSGGFGLGGGGNDAHPDGWQPVYDAYQPPPASPDASTTCASCDLLMQNCPSRSACYRSGSDACCAPGGALPENSQCTEDDQCDKGLVCVNNLCAALCDITAPRCGPACKVIGRYPNVGYCAP